MKQLYCTSSNFAQPRENERKKLTIRQAITALSGHLKITTPHYQIWNDWVKRTVLVEKDIIASPVLLEEVSRYAHSSVLPSSWSHLMHFSQPRVSKDHDFFSNWVFDQGTFLPTANESDRKWMNHQWHASELIKDAKRITGIKLRFGIGTGSFLTSLTTYSILPLQCLVCFQKLFSQHALAC